MLQGSEPVAAIPEAATEKSDKSVGLYQFETLPEVAKHFQHLTEAVSSGVTHEVELLLSRGADPNEFSHTVRVYLLYIFVISPLTD